MDLRVHLTWLLLLSTTLLAEPASGAWWEQSEKDLKSVWEKFANWIKEKLDKKDAIPSTVAPTVAPDVSSAPTIVTEETTTSAPEIPATADEASHPATTTAEESRTSEIPITPQTASANASEPNVLRDELVAEETTSAAEILSTPAETTVSPTAEPADEITTTASSSAEPADVTTPAASSSAEPADVTTPAVPPSTAAVDITTTTVSPSTAPADITPAATSTGAPADSATAPVEDTTTEAAVTTELTTAENPVTSTPAASVPPTPETTDIATANPQTDAATTGSAELIPLPDYVRQLLLQYLKRVCQPRRPGMPEVTLEGCVYDPTCGNQPSSSQRLIQLRYRAPVTSRVCLRCRVSGCIVPPPPPPPPRPFPGYRPRPPRPFPGNRRRARRSADGVVIVIAPQ